MSLYRRFHDRFGTAGLILGMIALVLALGGSAIAAKNGLTGKQKKEVKKIAMQFAGKDGAPGTPGAPGPAGPQGPAGANGNDGQNGTNGQDGADGTDGTPGSDGVDGKSVVVANEAPTNCSEGGVTYEVEDSSAENEICNGEEGSPWVVGQAPKGSLLKGTWAVPNFKSGAGTDEPVWIAFSTGVPIGSFIAGITAFFVPVAEQGQAGHPNGCTGTAAKPTSTAEAALCVYEGASTNLIGPTVSGHHKVDNSGGGMVAQFKTAAAETVTGGYGSWALLTP